MLSEALFETLEHQTKKLRVNQLIGADNRPKDVKKGKVKRTTIGTRPFKNMNTLFSDISHINEGYNLNIDGLIGYEMLHRQKTVLSYNRKELLFVD